MKNIDMSHVAAMNLQYRYYPLERFLDDTVESGLANVELWGAAPVFHLEDMTYLQVKAVRHEIERRGLHLVCLTPEQCVYPINLAAPSREERFRSIKFFENHLRAAAELGAEKMLVTSGWGYFDGSNHDEAWKYAREGIFDLAELAKQHGMMLALEVLRHDESNLVYNLPTLKQMLLELNHESVGGMIDTIPMALAGETPADYLRELGEKLIHIHFIDGAPRGHLAWGDGVLDPAGYLKELDEGGYRGYLSLEITDDRYYMEPWKSLMQSVEVLSGVLNRR